MNLAEAVAAFKDEQPRSMPEDFAPALIDDGETVRWISEATEYASAVSFGFRKTDDPALNGRAMLALRQTIWRTLEQWRLFGRWPNGPLPNGITHDVD